MLEFDEQFRVFQRWREEHGPMGNMDAMQHAIAYSEWASKNSIERYLDDAQPTARLVRDEQI